MHPKPQRKRAGKRLLAAAIGVATVSYMGVQSGCAPDTDATDDERGTNSAVAEDDAVTPDVSEHALSISTTELRRPLPTSGNLVPPPQIAISQDQLIVLPPKVFPPSGNLMPPPGVIIVKPPVVTVPVLPPSGNLMAPPVIDPAAVETLETN